MSKFLLRLIPSLLSVASPEIKKALCELVAGFHKKADETPNAWDNILADLLADLFCE